MVVNISNYKSHPHKELTVHTQGVMDNVKQLTSSKLAALAALFHDLGKLNPNFQNKLFDKPVNGYANHAYLSSYGLLCFCVKNQKWLKNELGESDFQYYFLSLLVIIAKHHGNLPDFELPFGGEESKECRDLFKFIQKNSALPVTEFIQYFEPEIAEYSLLKDTRIQENYTKLALIQKPSNILDYFLSTQYDFSCLIQSDKTDAGDYVLDREDVTKFCSEYNIKLSDYLGKLKGDTPLNQLRTQIRLEALVNLENCLKKSERVFALTSATGSGKTLMMLALAGKIIEKTKQNLRIIYTIPFLSITEQVENECLSIFGKDFIQRIDSKSENYKFQELQDTTDGTPEKQDELITCYFKEDIFSYPFVITTFVRFFETLVSNRNSTLLKLPSFSNCIFLIDEIQSLPPRLYSFFVAYLDAFCKKHNSYAIVSTATMPNFSIPNNDAIKLFEPFQYQLPSELLSFDYFKHQLFNRYTIEQRKETVDIDTLAQSIIKESQSLLVILNTIDDSKDLYKILSEHFKSDELLLLNTHFTPNDRKEKIKTAKNRLATRQKVILVSTQLIEAGVDIDFPVLYRDMAILPSIVQSAGRCNRNGRLPNGEKGKVVLFNLTNRDKARASLIYRGKDKVLLDNTTRALLLDSYSETSLFEVQKKYFDFVNTNLIFGEHEQKQPKAEINFVRDINEIKFDLIGKFRLIDEDFYGEEFKCYVPIDDNDKAFDKLLEEQETLKEILRINRKNYKSVKLQKIAIENHLKRMSGQIVQIRLKKDDVRPLTIGEPYFDLLLIDKNSYSFESGINLSSDNQFLI